MVHDMDPHWLDVWIYQWGDKMTQYAYLQIHDREWAQDIAQEAFFRLYRYQEEHPDAILAVGWLYTVTKNLVRDAQRKKSARPERSVRTGSWEPLGDSMATRIEVQQVLNTLRAKDRECLWLFYYADYSIQQIAERLHLSTAGVRTRLHRARQRFATQWGRSHEHED